MSSLLGRIFAAHAVGKDIDAIRPGRNFSRQDVVEIADRSASEFRSDNMNLLSAFELEGEFGLYATLNNFIQTKSILTDEITEAVSDGDEVGLIDAFKRAMETAFVTLADRGLLKRLQLVDEFPAEAAAEYKRMKRSVTYTQAISAVKALPDVTDEDRKPVVPVETPVETCAREFHEMPSSKWKAKWLDNQHNKPVAEQAASEGRI